MFFIMFFQSRADITKRSIKAVGPILCIYSNFLQNTHAVNKSNVNNYKYITYVPFRFALTKVVNGWKSRLVIMRTWFWLRVLEVLWFVAYGIAKVFSFFKFPSSFFFCSLLCHFSGI